MEDNTQKTKATARWLEVRRKAMSLKSLRVP